jgi:HlyD family type I secretion membrane fusion protein
MIMLDRLSHQSRPLGPVLVGEAGEGIVPDQLSRRIRSTIFKGCLVIAVFIVGFGVWASVTSVPGAVPAPGTIKVENNRKTVKHLESGILRQILVHDGDQIRKGQLLFEFDDTQARDQVQELQNAYDSTLAEQARFEAEAAKNSAIRFPPELLARANDPTVASTIASEKALFDARRLELQSQVSIGDQKISELNTQIEGLNAQVASIDAQRGLNSQELGSVKTLYDSGYAPESRVLSLQRETASLQGSRGQETAEIGRTEEAIGEARMDILESEKARVTEAAAGLQTTQEKLADLGPKLAQAKDLLSHTKVYAPIDGTVMDLTQFTEGGVVGPEETLLQIVPSGQPLIIEVRVKPRDAHAVHPGQRALVTLSAYNTRTTPRIYADVVNISADQETDPKTGQPYFTAQLRIPNDQLRLLPSSITIYPGMPVSTSIVNGERTIIGYLIGPLRDVLAQSMQQ